MGQVMFETDELRAKMLAQNAVRASRQKTLAELKREAELKEEAAPYYAKELTPSEADVVRKGPKSGPEASAKQNAWIWYYGMEQDTRFKSLSMGEQNSRRMKFFNESVLPYVTDPVEGTELRKVFAARGFSRSFGTAAEQTFEAIGPPVTQEGMLPPKTYREMGATPDPMQLIIGGTEIERHPNVDPNAPPPPLNPLGAAVGHTAAGLVPYMLAGMVAPPVAVARPFLSGMLRGAVTMGIPQADMLLAGRITPGEALKGTIQGTLAFGPRKIWQGVAMAAGFDAAFGSGPVPSYTGVPALDRALTAASQTAVMRYAFEAPHKWDAFQAKAYNDKLSNYLNNLSYRESHVNLLAERSKTGGEMANVEKMLLERLSGIKEFTPTGVGTGNITSPNKDRITPILPEEETQAMERYVKNDQEDANRRMARATTELVPLLEAKGLASQVVRLQTAADRLRASFGKAIPETEKLDAHMNWANTVDVASTAVGRAYPELVFGGNAIVSTSPQVRGTEARSKIGARSRAFLEAWEANPPTIDIERWNRLSGNLRPDGGSERSDYLRDLAVGPKKALTEEVLRAIGEDRNSVTQLIQTALTQKVLGEPTAIDGLGLPKVSLLGQRNIKETKTGAVPQDPQMQDNLREAQYLLDEIDHATGLTDATKTDLKRMVLNGTMPAHATGRLQVYPKHVNSAAEAKSKQAMELSDDNAKLLIAELANKAGGPTLTEAQARASALSQVPEGQEPPAFVATGEFKPETPPGQGAIDQQGVLRNHFLQRYDLLRENGYDKIEAYGQVMEELAAVGIGPATTLQSRIAAASTKVGDRKSDLITEFPADKARGLDYETLADDQRVIKSMGGSPYQGMTRGETEADPFAVVTELNRVGLNGRYDRENNRIEVETKPGSRQFVPVSFQELKNFAGPGNFTPDGQLILETRGGTYMIVRTKDGKFDIIDRNKAHSKGPQRPLTPTEAQAVLYSNTGWKVEVFFPDGSLQIFDPSTRETRLVTPEEAQHAITHPKPVEEAMPGFPGRPNPESYDPTKERDTPTDPIPSFPEEPLPRGTLGSEILYRQKGIYSRVLNTKTGEMLPYRGSILPHEIRYAINERTGEVKVSELGSRATLPSELPEELRGTRGTAGPAMPNLIKQYRNEYEAKVPLPPRSTPEQLRDWREGMAAYVASRIKKGGVTLGMGAVENPFGKKPTQAEFKASIEELTRQQRERERLFTEAELKAEEALRLQVTAKGAAKDEYATDEVDEMMLIRKFLQNELVKPERGRGTIMHLGAPSMEEAPGFVRKAVAGAKMMYKQRKDIGPPGLIIPTKDVFSVLQEGKVGQKYGLKFYDLWRMVENYAISTRSWSKELAPKEAALIKALKTRNQDAIRAYLEVDPKDWQGKLQVRRTYNMRKEDIDLAPHVQELLEKAFGKYWREFLTEHYPSYRNSKLGNNEEAETAVMKTWRTKGGLNGHPADLIEMIPNAISSRARMSMNPAFDKILETVRKINDLPEDLELNEAYQTLKGKYVDVRGPDAAARKADILKTMKAMENTVMPRAIKQELIGKLMNYQARVSWGVSTDHEAAQTFLETVYKGAGINVDKALFGKILPNYLLLTYTATMPGRIGMVLRNLAQPTMTLLPYVGPENFARGQQVYWAHVSGVKRIPELDSLFKELGVDKLQGASTEQLLANEVESSTASKVAASWLRRKYNAAMKPFNWSELTNRRISITTGYLAMKEYGSLYLQNKISMQTLMRRTGMIYMEKASQGEILETLGARDLDLASKRFAQNLAEDTQWMYSAGNTPEIFNSKMGRFFGQFGTWPLSFWRFAKRGAMSGDKIANMQFLVRMVMVNAALDQATKKVFGVNAGSWLWLGPFSYFGGPGASMFASAYYAAGKGFRHELGMHDLLNQMTNLIPFYMAGRDINRAIHADSLTEAMKRITGFKSYEK